MNVLMEDESSNCCCWRSANWVIAIQRNGHSRCGAYGAAVKRFIFWHMIQPVMYAVVLSPYAYWDQLDTTQHVLGMLVLLREALYVLLLLVALVVNPAFLLVDVPASVGSDRTGVHHPVAGELQAITYIDM